MKIIDPIGILKKTIIIEMSFAAIPAFGAAFSGGVAATAVATGAATVGASAGFLASAGSLLSTISTGLSIFSTISGGISESRNLKEQASAEKFNARNRQIERKRNLIRSLALQNVRGASSGVQTGFGSSAQAIQLEDISRADLDQVTDTAATGQRVNRLKQNASNVQAFSLLSAGSEATRPGVRKAKRGEP